MHSDVLYPFISMTLHRSPTGKVDVVRFRTILEGVGYLCTSIQLVGVGPSLMHTQIMQDVIIC
jgi:hypothetical protein